MYKVEVKNSGDYLFKVQARGNEFVIDPMGSGVSPADALLASLGSCMGFFCRRYIESANLGINDLSITLEGEFTRDAPICLKEIRVLLDLKGSQVEERRKAALLEFIKNCPIGNTLKGNPEITVTIN
ncbi:MAG: OsmC family protein [Candidatus Omnitrophica bacterium]|jgi:uncharacterized OsmC-like protein|nr:OsmC family protein [Candidatus Omnitrophota bacterium]MDD5079321.1 OsmC family protein [Candidatus Omnitrophota bacterium]